MKNFKNKVAVVTGASSGLGKAVAESLSNLGVKVLALSRNISNQAFDKNVIKIPLNIRDLDSIDQAFKSIDEETKKIDFLINCAGRELTKSLEDTDRQDIMDVFGVNLKGNIYVAQEVYRRMIPKKSGHIINVSSTSGIKGRAMESIYCASKWGLRGFTESLRLEAKEHKIKVTSFSPGGMNSNFWGNHPGKDLSSYMNPALVAEEIIKILDTDSSISASEVVIERM